ncbi:MAG: hypothetical protein SFV52_06975 [Saprospiraceae bacterium]|nr:hypothetical protein [Saprospiraceae bacterium]
MRKLQTGLEWKKHNWKWCPWPHEHLIAHHPTTNRLLNRTNRPSPACKKYTPAGSDVVGMLTSRLPSSGCWHAGQLNILS